MHFHSSFIFLFLHFCVFLFSPRYRSDGTKKEPIKISSMVRGVLILLHCLILLIYEAYGSDLSYADHLTN